MQVSGVPPDLSGPAGAVTQVVIGLQAVTALLPNGTLAVWGTVGTLGSPLVWSALRGVVRLAGGYVHVLALLRNGTLTGFGVNFGDSVQSPIAIPSDVNAALAAGTQRLVDFAAGNSVSIVLLGPPTTSNSSSGVVVNASRSAGGNYTVHAWGAEVYALPPSVSRALAQVGAVQVAACDRLAYMMLLGNGTAVVWGDGKFGLLDVPAAARSGVRSVACGIRHALALLHNGTVVGWGNNTQAATVPAGLAPIKAVAAGPLHAVALTTQGRVVQWGEVSEGLAQVPDDIQGGVQTISAGYGASAALTSTAPPGESGSLARAAGTSVCCD